MALEAGQKYNVEVVSAYNGNSAEKGTPGLFFTFKSEDGKSTIDHVLYVSPGTIDRVIKVMDECFGVGVEELGDPKYLRNLNEELKGRRCSITTEAEEYNGKEIVKVKWMNPAKRKTVNPGVESKTAQLFRGMGGTQIPGRMLDDVPF